MSFQERRKSPRLEPHQVPWIREVKPANGDNATLVNISRTGVLLETTAKLKPGRRSALIIVGDPDEKARTDVDVIRTELVSIGAAGELIYRTAMAFIEELDLRVTTDVRPAPHRHEVPAGQPRVEHVLDGVWNGPDGSHAVRVAGLTQTGCEVQAGRPVTTGTSLALTILFSPVRSLCLSGVVMDIVDGSGCRVGFVDTAHDAARLLRVEIRELMAACERGGLAAAAEQVAPPTPAAGFDWRTHAGSLHVNQW